jgi:hypothetical protein
MHVHTVVSVALAPVHADAVVCVAELHVMQFEHETAPPGAYVVPEQGEQVLRPFVAANLPTPHGLQVRTPGGSPRVLLKPPWPEMLPAAHRPAQELSG